VKNKNILRKYGTIELENPLDGEINTKSSFLTAILKRLKTLHFVDAN